jgi:general secretion pathway protein E
MRAPLVSRIKIMAGLNIAERRLPQDGRLRISVRGQDIDLRVATVPTIHGESVVMRILDRSQLALDFPSLGFDSALIVALRQAIGRPNGIVLVTGPTGSGKTTTLYAALSELNRPDHKVLTVEDPIEYRLPGVIQTQVNPQIGLTFDAALRSFLRLDPDVIMVGEIRDTETAQIAVQAAR